MSSDEIVAPRVAKDQHQVAAFALDNNYTPSRSRNEFRFTTIYDNGSDSSDGWAIEGWGWHCWQGKGAIKPRVIFGQIIWLYRHGDPSAAHALKEQATKRLRMTPKIVNQIVKDSLAAIAMEGK